METEFAFDDGADASAAGAPRVMALYLQDLADQPRLTLGEEQALARLIDTGRRAAARLGSADVTASECRLLEGDQRAGLRAQRRLVEANLRLVIHLAKRYRRFRVPVEDLIQEGNLGLLRAAETYELGHDSRFATYAAWFVRKSFYEAIRREYGVTKREQETHRRMVAMELRLEQTLKRQPSPAEIAEAMGWESRTFEHARAASARRVAIEELIEAEAEVTRGDFLVDSQAIDPIEQSLEGQAHRDVDHALGWLTAREERVVRLRFGLAFGNGNGLTLDAVGRKLQLTRERVRQIEAQALGQLRRQDPWRERPAPNGEGRAELPKSGASGESRPRS